MTTLNVLRRGWFVLWLACLASLPFVTPGWSQDSPPPAPAAAPAAATPEAAPPPAETPPKLDPAELQKLEDLVGMLQDQGTRERFVNDLKALIAAQKQIEPTLEEAMVEIPAPETLGAKLIFAISSGIRDLSENIMEGVSVVSELPAAGAWIHEQLIHRDSRNFWGVLFGKLVLVLIGGYIAEWLVRRALAHPVQRLEAAQPPHIWGRALLVLIRGILELLPLAGFAAAAYFLLPFAGSSQRARFVVLAVVNAHIAVGVVLALARMAFMPTAPNLRLRQLNDETANYLFIWVRRLAAIIIYGYFAAEAGELLGLSASGKALLLKLVGLIAASMLIVLVMQNRKNVADWLRGTTGPDEMPTAFGVFRRRLADVWHVLVALYLVAFYLVWILDIGFIFLLRATVLTIVILVAARLLIVASTKIVARAFRVGHDLTLRYPGLETRANRYLPALGRILRTLIYVVAGLLILQAWGVQSLAWLTSRSGVQFIGTGLGILVVLTLALIAWEMISLGLDRYSARVDATSRSSARLRTLLPLVRTIVLVVLSVMVGLVVLSQIGINITPLLAGAGVIGLAVGFGSQKLVQDVINGLFILAEDTVSIGDVVDLGGQSGLVEEITIRHIRLRDFSANVITVPFSEVKTVTNMTRDYSRYVFDIGIAYKEDVDQVIQVLKALDEEMRKDDRFAPLILAPLEIIGLDKFADSAVILKARYMTLPIKQWDVGREFNRRIKKRFDELGIEIPFPHLMVYVGKPSEVGKDANVAPLPEPDDGDEDGGGGDGPIPGVPTTSGAGGSAGSQP